jgi:hypothetical protein
MWFICFLIRKLPFNKICVQFIYFWKYLRQVEDFYEKRIMHYCIVETSNSLTYTKHRPLFNLEDDTALGASVIQIQILLVFSESILLT